jgi:hypothetical protein
MKFKLLPLTILFLPTAVFASGSYYTLNANSPPGGAQPPAPITIKPSPPPNQQPKNNVGGTQGVQGPQKQVGGANTQPGDGRTLQSSSQIKEQFLVSPRTKNGTSGRAESAIEIKKADIKQRAQDGIEDVNKK